MGAGNASSGMPAAIIPVMSYRAIPTTPTEVLLPSVASIVCFTAASMPMYIPNETAAVTTNTAALRIADA